jgi:MFS family permease
MGASGVGALCGAAVLAARRGVHGLRVWVALGSAALGVTLVAFSLSRSFWLSVALVVPAGFFMILQMASSNTLIQAMVPDHLRGRVMALYTMMFMGMAPFGALLAGALAHRLGAPQTVALGGVVCFAGASIFAMRLGALREQTEQLIAAQQLVNSCETPAAGTKSPSPGATAR